LETKMDLFKCKQYESAIILLTVRWYLKYSLSYRDIVEMMNERGLRISHTTAMRWSMNLDPKSTNESAPF
jgi:IS6 family transposase